MPMSIVQRAEQFIKKEGLLTEGDHVVVAVSGGPDSTALLYVLKELSAQWNLKLHVAHMDHGFRGEESRREAEWVRVLAERLRLPCTIRYADIPAIRKEHGNPQEIARNVRYAFLTDTAREIGARVIALGHHADDQAETILLKLLRGTALSGLGGMSPKADREGVKLIRPMLRIIKEEILDYMREHDYSYCTDSSNAERKYTRNRLRLDVVPVLQQYNPEFTHTLNRMADIVRDEDRLLTRLAESDASRLFRYEHDEYRGSRDGLLQLDVALQRRVIKLILSYLCVNKEIVESIHIERVREAMVQDASPTIALHLPDVTFIREYDHLRFVPGHTEKRVEAYAYTVSHADIRLAIKETGACLVIQRLGSDALLAIKDSGGFDERSAYFDAEQLDFPLTVRSRRPGDRISLMNMQGTTKLKDLFISLKIPRSERDAVPLVFDAEGRLLWIAGVRRSRHAPVRETTKNVLRIKLEQNECKSNDID